MSTQTQTQTPTQTSLTFTQKISQTIKRLAVAIPLLAISFGATRVVIGDMGAAAIAFVLTAVVVNVYFADPSDA